MKKYNQRPKINLLGKSSKRNHGRLDLSRNLPHLNHFEATPTLNADGTLCRDLRKISERGYLKDINNYLDSRGVDEDGYVVPERVLEYQRRLDLQEEIKIAEELIASENELEDELSMSEPEFLHRKGMHIVGKEFFYGVGEECLESSVYE